MIKNSIFGDDNPSTPKIPKQFAPFKVDDIVTIKKDGKTVEGVIDRIDGGFYYITDNDAKPIAVISESELISMQTIRGGFKIKKTRKSKRRGSKKRRTTKRRRR
jgi:hypothetical protein